MPKPIVSVKNISKHYRLGTGVANIQELIFNPSYSTYNRDSQIKDSKILWAVKDISFDIDQGEAVAIIGPNGAGKTTVLKLLSGITKPTGGSIKMTGQLASLIELGAGFHPDLTGRENVFLNGAILGIPKKKIKENFESIIDFAGLERFVDTPVKRYSSGMYVRLGFAVAVHVNPDILLVDEVLAVGDASFQAKCYRRLKDLMDSGTTIILVSHQMATVQRVCSRTILMNKGQIKKDGPTEEVVSIYYQTLKSSNSNSSDDPTPIKKEDTIAIRSITLYDNKGSVCETFESKDDLIIKLEYETPKRIEEPTFSISIRSTDQQIYTGYVTKFDDFRIPSIEGIGAIELVIPELGLGAGTYDVHVGIWDKEFIGGYAWQWNITQFKVVSNNRNMLGRFFLPHYWRIIEN